MLYSAKFMDWLKERVEFSSELRQLVGDASKIHIEICGEDGWSISNCYVTSPIKGEIEIPNIFYGELREIYKSQLNDLVYW